MHNFLQTDNKPRFHITGASIFDCEYSSRIRDDLSLLLSQDVDVNVAVKKILDYYPYVIKEELTAYEFYYYLPVTFIALAYYLAKNGYYHEYVFTKAIELIDSKLTLFPWEDLTQSHQKSATSFRNLICQNFAPRYEKLCKLFPSELNVENDFINVKETPKLISQLYIITATSKWLLNKRIETLENVKKLLLAPPCKANKPNISWIIHNANTCKFSIDNKEGDVLAYRIKSGKFKDKYAILVLDYVREKRKILCDYNLLVEKWEYFALLDKLYDEIPDKILSGFISTGVKKDIDDNLFYLNHFCITEKTENFGFVKVCNVTPPKLEKSASICLYVSPKEEDLAKEIIPSNVDELITKVFDN